MRGDFFGSEESRSGNYGFSNCQPEFLAESNRLEPVKTESHEMLSRVVNLDCRGEEPHPEKDSR
jgi:hypothetical protein